MFKGYVQFVVSRTLLGKKTFDLLTIARACILWFSTWRESCVEGAHSLISLVQDFFSTPVENYVQVLNFNATQLEKVLYFIIK